MDPLSVAASITGLIVAGGQIASLIQRFLDAPSIAQTVGGEITHFVVVLSELQPYVTGSSSAHHSRTSLVDVQQIQIILTGCVLTVSELQAVVSGLSQGSTPNIGIRDRMKWLLAESNISQLVQRLRDHKSSLTLILTLLTCKSTSEAVNSMSQLRQLLEHFIQHNAELFNRVQELEEQSQVLGPPSVADASPQSATSNTLAYENVLFDSHLYKRVGNRPDNITRTSGAPSVNMSIQSGLSLSQVTNISRFRLAVSVAQLSNPQCYTSTPTPGTVSDDSRHVRLNPLPRLALTGPVRGPARMNEGRVAWATGPHEVSSDGQHDAAWVLLASGADKEAIYSPDHTPIQSGERISHIMGLHEACRIGQHETVTAHLKSGASVEDKNSAGDRLLHVAARNGHHETVRVLLQSGADIEARNPCSECPLHLASRDGHQETVRLLLQWVANIEAGNSRNDRPLHLSAGHGQSAAMSILLEYGAAVYAQNSTGDHAVHVAASNGHSENVSILLRSGTSKDVRTRYRRTPLHSAASNGQHDTVKLLLQLGAKIEAESHFGSRPLHVAASNGNGKTVQVFLEAGADIEAEDSSRYRPLHFAARAAMNGAVEVLLAFGADIETETSSGDRALHIAVSCNNLETVRVLLASGANVEAKNYSGERPLHLATTKAHEPVRVLMESVGGNRMA